MDNRRTNKQPTHGQTDAVTGATSLADAAAALDPNHGASGPTAPPSCPPPGACNADADAVTGATLGVTSACRELGMSSVDDVVRERGIKPPGVA